MSLKLDKSVREARKQEVLDFIKRERCRPSLKAKRISERRLSSYLLEATSPANPHFDRKFCKILESLGFRNKRRQPNPTQRKTQLYQFVQQNGFLPKPENKGLYWDARNYVRLKGPCFDPVFAEQIQTLCSKNLISPETEKIALLEFCQRTGKWPQKDFPELFKYKGRYCSPDRKKLYDSGLTKRCTNLIAVHWARKIKLERENALNWIKENKRTPRHPCVFKRASEQERQAYVTISSARMTKSNQYDPDFILKVSKLIRAVK